MTLRIKNKGIVPRGTFWRYKQPETGELIKASDWGAFLGAIKKHRRGRNIPVGLGFEAEIEAYVCEHQSEMCEDFDPTIPRIDRLSMGDIVRGGEVFVRHAVNGSQLVTQEEANRRASICAKCRYNTTFSKPCSGLCTRLKEIMSSTVGQRFTPYDSDLRACFICHCWTSIHVWFPLDVLDAGLTTEMREQFSHAHDRYQCWKWKEDWETESTPGLPA
jgi:hypothetical protein